MANELLQQQRPDLSFKAQREALAQVAGAEPAAQMFQDNIRSADALLRMAGRNSQPAVARTGGITPEVLAALDKFKNSPIEAAIQGGQTAVDYSRYGGAAPGLASGIRDTAQALGMDPEDLATIISYETAGSFDPTKAGPTTQWGQHRGLIQFGEPQAKEYGVNWDDPIGSQLGPNGAIVRYFQKNGWKPGMSGMDAYSIVNAGAPGRYSASDAQNGGAPGSVADKWMNQMTDHRQKARNLFGLS